MGSNVRLMVGKQGERKKSLKNLLALSLILSSYLRLIKLMNNSYTSFLVAAETRMVPWRHGPRNTVK